MDGHWISADLPPAEDVPVLVVTWAYGIVGGEPAYDVGYFWGGQWMTGPSNDPDSEAAYPVTHWMALPPLPGRLK